MTAEHGLSASPTTAMRAHVVEGTSDTRTVRATEDPLSRAPVPSPGPVFVVVTRGPDSGARFALHQPTTTVGRHPNSDVFLDDVAVSRRHAEFRTDTTGVRVVDIESLTGTYVNGTAIGDAIALTDGDDIQIGKFHLVFSAGPAVTAAHGVNAAGCRRTEAVPKP